MVAYVVQASWILIAATVLSLPYELYRATVKAGISEWDSMGAFLTQGIPGYVLIFALAILVRRGWLWVVWLGLLLSIGLIGVSIFYYSPVVLPARQPGPVDWFEDKVYTGLLFVASALLIGNLQKRRWFHSKTS